MKVPVVDNVLSSHEQEIYPTTSLDENSIEFEFQKDRNVYVDLRQTYLALKIKLVKGRGFDTYKTTEKEKEHKEDTVFAETGDDDVEFIEEVEGVPHFTLVNNILHSIFSNAELYINNHEIYNSNGFLLTNLTFLTISKVHCQRTTESCIVKGMTMKKIQRIYSKVHFSQVEWNCTVDLTVPCCTASWVSIFIQLRNYYIQIWKYESD